MTTQINSVPEQGAMSFVEFCPVLDRGIQHLTDSQPFLENEFFPVDRVPADSPLVWQSFEMQGKMPKLDLTMQDWAKYGGVTDCGNVCRPKCEMNFKSLGGTAINRNLGTWQHLGFHTDEICREELGSVQDIKRWFAYFMMNLYDELLYYKVNNIGKAAMWIGSQKFILDAEGLKADFNNPRDLPTLLDTQGNPLVLKFPDMKTLQNLYNELKYVPGSQSVGRSSSGSPLYILAASEELLENIWYLDPQMIENIRYSSMADQLITRYGITSSYRGMFAPMIQRNPLRFNRDTATGVPYLVDPLVDINAEAGVYSSTNPEWLNAEFEMMWVLPNAPFRIMARPRDPTIGEGTTFGQVPAYFDRWEWIQPDKYQNPLQDRGRFWTYATIGMDLSNMKGVRGILVPRDKSAGGIYLDTSCPPPPSPQPCTNVLADSLCPCPLVVDYDFDKYDPTQVDIYTTSPQDVTSGDTIQLSLDNGGTVAATVGDKIRADKKLFRVTLQGASLPANKCIKIVGIACSQAVRCESQVVHATDCRAGVTNLISVTTRHPIAADAGDSILVVTKDGQTITATISSFDALNNTYRLSFATPTDADDFFCNAGPINKLCVPASTNAACNGCANSTPLEVDCVNPTP